VVVVVVVVVVVSVVVSVVVVNNTHKKGKVLSQAQNKYRGCRGSMARKNRSNPENQAPGKDDGASQKVTGREAKIMNSIINTTIILMSTMMDTFTEAMVNTTGAMASGMADAIVGKEASQKVNKEFRKKLPEADEKMKAMISEVRKDVYAQLEEKRKEMKSLLSDSAFDIGPKIVEKYDFRLPKLTEKLDDSTLAQYTQLLVSEDPRFAKMFKELTSWIEHTPKFPAKTSEK